MIPARSSGIWEIDECDGENAGLVLAEVDVDRADQPFERPAWLEPFRSTMIFRCKSTNSGYCLEAWRRSAIICRASSAVISPAPRT